MEGAQRAPEAGFGIVGYLHDAVFDAQQNLDFAFRRFQHRRMCMLMVSPNRWPAGAGFPGSGTAIWFQTYFAALEHDRRRHCRATTSRAERSWSWIYPNHMRKAGQFAPVDPVVVVEGIHMDHDEEVGVARDEAAIGDGGALHHLPLEFDQDMLGLGAQFDRHHDDAGKSQRKHVDPGVVAKMMASFSSKILRRRRHRGAGQIDALGQENVGNTAVAAQLPENPIIRRIK